MLIVHTRPDILIEDGYTRISITPDGMAHVHGGPEIRTVPVRNLWPRYVSIAVEHGYASEDDLAAAEVLWLEEEGVSI